MHAFPVSEPFMVHNSWKQVPLTHARGLHICYLLDYSYMKGSGSGTVLGTLGVHRTYTYSCIIMMREFKLNKGNGCDNRTGLLGLKVGVHTCWKL